MDTKYLEDIKSDSGYSKIVGILYVFLYRYMFHVSDVKVDKKKLITVYICDAT